MSDSETTATSGSSSTDEESEESLWAPGGSKYEAHRLRVYGGGTVPWASGLQEARASAARDSTVATRELVAAQDAMAQAYDAFNDALDAHLGDDASQEMLRKMIVDFKGVSTRLKSLIARVESDPYHDPIPSWHAKSRRWDSDNRAAPGRK